MRLVNKPLSDVLATYSMPEPNSGCLLWLGTQAPDGYGFVRHRGVRYLAHRAAWVCQRGHIPPGMLICHTCDNPACVNPEHLFLGTQADNMRDKMRKNRGVRANAKISFAIAEDIRAAVSNGMSKSAAARQFGIDRRTVQQIVGGTAWVRP